MRFSLIVSWMAALELAVVGDVRSNGRDTLPGTVWKHSSLATHLKSFLSSQSGVFSLCDREFLSAMALTLFRRSENAAECCCPTCGMAVISPITFSLFSIEDKESSISPLDVRERDAETSLHEFLYSCMTRQLFRSLFFIMLKEFRNRSGF